MGEVIAIPLSSERRAAVVLAALRRLEAEYRVPPPAAGNARRRFAGHARAATRRVRWTLRRAGVPGLTGGIVGVTLAAAAARNPDGLRWSPELLGALGGVLLVLALGCALGAALGLALDAARRRRTRRGATDHPIHHSGSVSWLVASVTVEPDGSGNGQVRASVLRISLPEAARGRLKAILVQAASTSAT